VKYSSGLSDGNFPVMLKDGKRVITGYITWSVVKNAITNVQFSTLKFKSNDRAETYYNKTVKTMSMLYGEPIFMEFSRDPYLKGKLFLRWDKE
jgi:hypothetical protein